MMRGAPVATLANPAVRNLLTCAIDRGWGLPPEWVTLFDTPVWHELDEPARQELSRHELTAFLSLNIHGERRLARLLKGHAMTHGLELAVAREELAHAAVFEAFCVKSGRGLHPDRAVELPDTERSDADRELLVLCRLTIFEEIVDAINIASARDPRLPDFVRELNGLHHRDESRHLAFGRARVRELWRQARHRHDVAGTMALLEAVSAFARSTWRQLASVDAYRACGWTRPLVLRDLALASPHRRQLARAIDTERLAWISRAAGSEQGLLA